MKTLFMLICLLNIGFFFWELHRGGLRPISQPETHLPAILTAEEAARAQRGSRLAVFLDKNLRELEHLPPPDRAASAAGKMKPAEYNLPAALATAETETVVCYEIGPFLDRKTLQAWLAANGLMAGEIFYKDTLVPSSYLVYFPPDKDPEQNRIHKMMLNAKGYTDVWAISSGELKGALSLGLFNDLARAVLFKKQLQQHGVQAEIKERMKSRSSLFVRVGTREPLAVKLVDLQATRCR